MNTNIPSPLLHDTLYQTAITALAHGINVLPIAGDGSKRPPFSWARYAHERISLFEVQRWFASPDGYPGLACVTGQISGNLEVIDFDDAAVYDAWCARMRSRGQGTLLDRLTRGYLEASPHGRHLLYRCWQGVEGNQKLAGCIRGSTQRRRKTLIETRGEGGLVVMAPSAGRVHPTGRSYTLLAGSLLTIGHIETWERQILLEVARSFDSLPPSVSWQSHQEHPRSAVPFQRLASAEQRPGDLFNQRATWDEVLVPHGWRLLYERDGEGYWTKHDDVHATTNYHGSDLFYVFSTATIFAPERGYSKFAAYTLLNHGGDFSAAARALVQQGYGSSLPHPIHTDASAWPFLLP